VRDHNGVLLGNLLTVNATGLNILNAQGYQYNVGWNGTVLNRQTWFAGANCTGAAAANGTVGGIIYGKIAFRASTGQFYKIASFNANFEAVGTNAVTAVSIDNTVGGCSASTGGTGYLLTPINPTDVGIPAVIVPPLQFP
jgi:hypothetical protein